MRVPVSTYRLQLGPGLRFRDAAGLVGYLDGLGVSDLYASPVFAARRGSTHGYDVVDATRLNPELGHEVEFDELAHALRARRMGLLLDVVPNHMAASPENPWWRDVLEHGPASAHADHFDIDWSPPGLPLRDRLLLPVLGKRYGRALESGELPVRLDDGGLAVHYFDQRIPLDPASYPAALGVEANPAPAPAAAAPDTAGPPSAPPTALDELLARFAALPPFTDRRPEAARFRRDESAALKAALTESYRSDTEVRRFVDDALARLNGRAGDPDSVAALDRLLDRQPYLLAFWKAATEEINYRRFFNIGDLICLRMERGDVFEAHHALVAALIREEKATGLRIDHVDGLYDPADYLRRLHDRLGGGKRVYVVVEKILSGDEELSDDWPVAGTTGYEFLNLLNGLFVDPAGLAALEETYATFTGRRDGFDEVVYRKKRQVMDQHFAGEVQVLARTLKRLAAADRHGRDLGARQLARALVEVTACLPVYRTYAAAAGQPAAGLPYLNRALHEARQRRPALGGAAFDFLRRVLLLRYPSDADAATRRDWLRFVMRWQQFSGPVMAKGFEDAALYVRHPLLSLNEVGAHPADGAVSVDRFHDAVAARGRRWPGTLNATSTHDTKRGEDVRARLNVLSELPREWERRLRRWHRWNRPHRTEVGGRFVPTPNEEVLIYQTLLGVWPLDENERAGVAQRVADYLVKAAREAKDHTSWLRPDPAHEDALTVFATRLLETDHASRFLSDMLRFHRRIAFFGALNGLAQLVLKIAAPGVPDLYQGCEAWDLSLVDPDNRRPVDFHRRARSLAELDRAIDDAGGDTSRLAHRLLRRWEDGRIKLFLTARALRFRRDRAALFRSGDYLPLDVHGPRAAHVVAFARRLDDAWAIAAAPRLCASLVRPGRFPLGPRVWADSHVLLPTDAPPRWRDVCTGTAVSTEPVADDAGLPLGTVFATLPVAMLASA